MPRRPKLPSGLTEAEVARLRGQLDAGRRPRVALSGPQFEAGASGSVVRIGDPAVDGADFLTVRVKVNGVTDELAFAPSELSIGGRTRSADGTKPAAAKPAAAKPAAAKPAAAKAARTGPARTAQSSAVASPSPAASGQIREAPDKAAPVPAGPDPAATSAQPAGSAAPTEQPARTTAVPAPAPAGGTGTGRRRKAPAAPAVSVTISSTGASWSVSASRGARTIAKNVPVTPGVVTAVADLLGQPSLAEAVAEINETARLQAEQRAEQLRAELSDLEAMLATHRAPR